MERRMLLCVVINLVYLNYGLNLVFGQIQTQADLDDIASNLDIKVKVVDNLQFDGTKHLLRVVLYNNASRSLSGTNWKLFLFSFFPIESKHIMSENGNFFHADGYVLEDYKLKVKSEGGMLYSMAPVSGFPELKPKEKRELSFFAALWAISKTDLPPNWYIDVNGLSPRVFKSTTSTSGKFVEDFSENFQWKRIRADLYNPYTPEERFNRYVATDTNPNIKLAIPTPKIVKLFDDNSKIDLTGNVYIVHNNLSNEANYLANKTGFEVVNSRNSAAVNIILQINGSIISNEGYLLETNPQENQILITGKTAVGIFYGIQTFLSLMSDGSEIQRLRVEDEPQYEFRGMHVDIARNFQPKSVLLKLLEAMATYKLNKLHLHATDDEGWRIEIKDLPELTEVGSKRCHNQSECLIPQLGSGPDTTTSGSGFLSIDDYKELLRFAKSRHIEVIPEIDSPGHARAAIMSMEARYKKYMKNGDRTEAEKYRLRDPNDFSTFLSVQYFSDNSLSPCLNSTYNFFDKIIMELKSMHTDAGHPLRIFHFGGDEVARNAWSNSTTCQKQGFTGDHARVNLKRHFAEQVAKVANKYDLNLLGWEDGFNEADGKPFNRKLFPNKDVISNAWDNVWEWGEGRRAYNFANAGFKVVMSHATHLYFDHPYEPDPEERGLYWATRFSDTLKTFGFMPDSLYDNIDVSRMGKPLDRHEICGDHDVKCPSLTKPENIIGMQGHLFSETILTEDLFDYMVFPRLLAVAERAWHSASWESIMSNETRRKEMHKDWDSFAHTVGTRELKRLDGMGIHYRVTPPGARVLGNVATIEAEYKDLEVEYSQDNGETWNKVQRKWNLQNKFKMLLRTRSKDGMRKSREVSFNPVNQDMIDYLAKRLEIKFDVIDNLIDEAKTFLQQISISNKGGIEILPGDWSIYFYHIRNINNLKPLEIQECGMVINHVTGSLYTLSPMRSSSKSILPNRGNTLICKFHAKYWSVALSDNMPNWYAWTDGIEPKTIESTAGESMNFVGPYNTTNKWKRYPEDQYDPFLPRTRYVMNSNVKDLGPTEANIKDGTFVIPTPVRIEVDTKESLVVDLNDSWVVEDNPLYQNVVDMISDLFTIPNTSLGQPTKFITIMHKNISKFPEDLAKPEGYFLHVDPDLNQIRIEANDPRGAFYAFQTLKRLSVKQSDGRHRLYKSFVADAPRFRYRGMFLDVGRNFHTKEEIITLLDFMASYKINKFLFHMSEDEGWRLEIPGLEQLTQVGSKRCSDIKERSCTLSQLGSGPLTNTSGSGFYTVDDYKEILRYANDRYIQVIPEFDMPGHARAAIVAMKERERVNLLKNNVSLANQYKLDDPNDQSEYMSVQWFTDNAINPCIESTYDFIDYLILSVKEIHNGIQDLEIFSFGGDEVARGAWEKSPLCIDFMKNNPGLDSASDLKEYFVRRVCALGLQHNLSVSAWEDGLMHGKDPFDIGHLVNNESEVYASAWDNVWEWGGGDRSYRLANAGYKVILAPATHLYFDHPYEPDPSERGYYWATRYTDTRKTFGFIPDNIYWNADVRGNGKPLTHEDICGGPKCFELTKPENIIGMMGLVWSETSRTKEQLHDRFFPRMLAAAERAWHKASWEDIESKDARTKVMNEDWTLFANRLGNSELKKLDEMGIKYRVPLPGAKLENDVLKTNTAFPGLEVEYSQDDGKTWKTGVISTSAGTLPKTHLRTRSADGTRTSRIVMVSETTSTANMLKISFSLFIFTYSCLLFRFIVCLM